MTHINPRLDPRRAKMLDLANKTVKGSIGRGHRRPRRRWKQLYHQWERCSAGRTYRHLRNFRCSGDAECDCLGCSCEAWTTAHSPVVDAPWWGVDVAPSLDDLGGALRSGEKWARRLGSSDAFLSWLKRNYPDTVAGRHAIEHIMGSVDNPRHLGCFCEIDWDTHGPKGNHGQCTCGAFRAKVNLCRADLSGEDLSGEDLSNIDLSEADLSEADLSGAPLYGANLAGANLAGANLRGANLRGANLNGANLNGADLAGANLDWARASADTVWPEGFSPRSAGVKNSRGYLPSVW